MNRLIFIVCISAIFSMSGCVMRTYTTEMDRVDQEIRGNRGYIMGIPPEASETGEIKKTREIYNIEIEVPSLYRPATEEKNKDRDSDKDLYGNRGYVQGGIIPEKEVYVGQAPHTTRLSGGPGSRATPQIVYSEPSVDTETSRVSENQKEYYVVQKGDTLQKISEKFFGTTKRWKDIYEANKQVLKTPDRIRAGQKLVIPK